MLLIIGCKEVIDMVWQAAEAGAAGLVVQCSASLACTRAHVAVPGDPEARHVRRPVSALIPLGRGKTKASPNLDAHAAILEP